MHFSPHSIYVNYINKKKSCALKKNVLLSWKNFTSIPTQALIIESVRLTQLVRTLYNTCRDWGSNLERLKFKICEIEQLYILLDKKKNN